MSLIKCPECGKEVSDKSVTCISCGFPLANAVINRSLNEKIEQKPFEKDSHQYAEENTQPGKSVTYASQETTQKKAKGLDEKFCNECGAVIKIKAEVCPKCGVRQKSVRGQVNKAVLLLLTFFFGGIGIHKFYLGQSVQGIFYLLFFWTWIPALIAIIEFIIYAITSEEDLQEKYSASGGSGGCLIIAMALGIIPVIGILAAVAIPMYADYTKKARQTNVHHVLRELVKAQIVYHEDPTHNGSYAATVQELDFDSTHKIEVRIIYADKNCFEATGKHVSSNAESSIDCNFNIQ